MLIMPKKSESSREARSIHKEPAYQVYRSRHRLFIDNLVGGVAWGVGGVIGATVVVAVILFVLAQLENFPFIGNIAKNIVEEMQSYQR